MIKNDIKRGKTRHNFMSANSYHNLVEKAMKEIKKTSMTLWTLL